jgi:acyl-CoA thioesterase-2
LPDESRHEVSGGQLWTGVAAATRTIDDPAGRCIAHAYFLRPGDPLVPILYEVDRIRDGRSFTTRRVVAIQHGKAIFNLQASFHPSPARSPTMMPTDVLDPSRCPTSRPVWSRTRSEWAWV